MGEPQVEGRNSEIPHPADPVMKQLKSNSVACQLETAVAASSVSPQEESRDWQQFGNNTGRATPMPLQCTSAMFVTFSLSKTRSSNVTPTCCQCHAHGRRTGLKIRSSQERVGSSPTFGTKATSPPNPRKGRGAGRTAAQGAVPRMVPLEWRIRRSIPDDDGRLTSALRGLVSNRCASSPRQIASFRPTSGLRGYRERSGIDSSFMIRSDPRRARCYRSAPVFSRPFAEISRRPLPFNVRTGRKGRRGRAAALAKPRPSGACPGFIEVDDPFEGVASTAGDADLDFRSAAKLSSTKGSAAAQSPRAIRHPPSRLSAWADCPGSAAGTLRRTPRHSCKSTSASAT